MSLFGHLNHATSCRDGYLTIGNFDGVHRGHAEILKTLVDLARSDSTHSTVLTFEPHPIHLLRPDQTPPRLTSLQNKVELIKGYGVDQVVVHPIDHNFLALTAEEFFDEVVIKTFAARGLVEGPNFFFGSHRSGTIEVLRSLCEQHAMTLTVVTAERSSTTMVSSTDIRNALRAGNITQANELLGRPYRLSGIVATGEQRGRTLGFPTANLERIETLLPAPGVYAARTEIDGQCYAVALHIGPKPTFATAETKVEAHLLDFNGDLYGQTIWLDLLNRLRGVIHFDDPAALQSQLTNDVAHVRKIVEDC